MDIRINETPVRGHTALATTGFALSLAVAGCAFDAAGEGDGLEDEDVGSTQLPVQFDAVGSYNLDFNNQKQKVTGVTALPWTSDGSVWASCGVTFVSKHFAITAAHCVPSDKAPIDVGAFFVQNINIDDFARRVILGDSALWQKFLNSRNVTANGPFPNWTPATPLTAADGWRFGDPSALVCGVRVRCSAQFGKERCPASLANQDNGNGVDIALIECPTRDAARPWTTVFSGDETVGMAVEAHWSHEVLKLSMEANDGIGPAGNFTNYGAYNPNGGDPAKANNWHYRGLLANQYFPLISRTFPNGATYKTTSSTTSSGTERFTDIYGCHGTSGSGVFPQGSDNRLLGPVVHGGSAMNGRLCARPSAITPGSNQLSFVRPAFTRQIEAMITFDR